MTPTLEVNDIEFEKLCGQQFDNGEHRTVHEVIGHPEMVMKVAIHSHFPNWVEYLISSSLEGHAIEFQVGKVLSISASGRFLLMERLNDFYGSLAKVPYPSWLNDVKRSAFGLSSKDEIKIRDYGMIKLGDQLGNLQYVFEEDRIPVQKIVPDGADNLYKMLMGPQIGFDGDRAVHEVIGESGMVLKVCNGSHKENALEWIIHSALSDIDAEELVNFASFECSLTGKYVLTNKLICLADDFCSHSHSLPWWLPVDRSTLGVDSHGAVKIRRWADTKFGELLVLTPAKHF